MTTRLEEVTITENRCPCCGGSNFKRWMQVPSRSEHGLSCYDLLRCSMCKHTWLDNRPTPEEIGSYYTDKYHRAISHAGETAAKRWRRQLQVISNYKASGRILDIGCSSGGFLSYLNSETWERYGIEASVPTAERARSISGADIFAGDVLDAVFQRNWFDVITCSDVLEHLYEPREVFRRVCNWLKPGGIFYVFVPNIMSWEARVFRSRQLPHGRPEPRGRPFL